MGSHLKIAIISNRSQSICRIVSGYRVLQMQGGGHADVLMYFKCPPTQQVQYPVNGYNHHLAGYARRRTMDRLHISPVLAAHIMECPGDVTQGADLHGLHEFCKHVASGKSRLLEVV